MRSKDLLAFLIPGLLVAMPAPTLLASQDQAVEVRLSRQRDLEFGDRIRVYVRTAEDGHLVVLHADPEGRIRVLFPLDPFDDDFVRSSRDYEIRDRGDRPERYGLHDESAGRQLARARRRPRRSRTGADHHPSDRRPRRSR